MECEVRIEREKEAKKCFQRIEAEAQKNGQTVPFHYWIEDGLMICETVLKNPSPFASFKNGRWIAFFEED